MTHKYVNQFYIDETNSESGPVVRWILNDQIPFSDILAEFSVAGLIDQDIVINSINQRKIEDKASIEKYIANRQKYGYSDEEKFEMRAAFGDEEVVDIFTGKVVSFA